MEQITEYIVLEHRKFADISKYGSGARREIQSDESHKYNL